MTDLHCLLNLLEKVPNLDKPIGKPWKFEMVNFMDGHLGRKEGRSLKRPSIHISKKASVERASSPIEPSLTGKRLKVKDDNELSSEEKRDDNGDDLYHRMFETLVGEAVASEIDSSFQEKKQKREKGRTSISINDIIN